MKQRKNFHPFTCFISISYHLTQSSSSIKNTISVIVKIINYNSNTIHQCFTAYISHNLLLSELIPTLYFVPNFLTQKQRLQNGHDHSHFQWDVYKRINDVWVFEILSVTLLLFGFLVATIMKVYRTISANMIK